MVAAGGCDGVVGDQMDRKVTSTVRLRSAGQDTDPKSSFGVGKENGSLKGNCIVRFFGLIVGIMRCFPTSQHLGESHCRWAGDWDAPYSPVSQAGLVEVTGRAFGWRGTKKDDCWSVRILEGAKTDVRLGLNKLPLLALLRVPVDLEWGHL